MPRLIFPVVAFVLPLALYLLTLAPTYVATDSAELALCIHYWGVCHPPGFPLYTAIGHFFVKLFPFGTLIWKVNLLSAIYGAGTVLLVYLTLVGLHSRSALRHSQAHSGSDNRLLALLVALSLAAATAFWGLAVIADVFTFGAFLFAVSFYLLFSGRKYLAFFVLGLSASHLYLTAFVLPVFLWYGWVVGKVGGVREVWGKLVAAAGVFGLGLFPQLIMYWRMLADTPVNWGHVGNFGQFFDFITRREFGSFFLLSTPNNPPTIGNFIGQFGLFVWNLVKGFGFAVPVFAIGGLVVGKVRGVRAVGGYWLWVVLGLIVLLQAASLAAIAPGETMFELTKFYVLPLTVFGVLVGVGLELLLFGKGKGKEASMVVGLGKEARAEKPDTLTPKPNRLLNLNLITSTYLVLIVTIVLQLVTGWKANNYSKNYFSQQYVVDALSQLPEDAVVITPEHSLNFGARYEQEVNGRFGGIEIINIAKRDDNPKYNPEFFAGEVDREFYDKVAAGRQLGEFEHYTLEAIARNLDRDIYLNQGEFENRLFGFLKPYVRPYGLWWQVVKEPGNIPGVSQGATLHTPGMSSADHVQRTIAGNYVAAYLSAATEYAKNGDFDMAIKLSGKVKEITPGNEANNQLFSNLGLIVNERGSFEDTVKAKNEEALLRLGVAYFLVAYYAGSAQVFEALIEIDPEKGEYFANAGASYASLGQKEKAREYFEKALVINPQLELAKKGLEQLKLPND